jgi:long-chain acyl-CoA synthetase
VSQEKKRYPEPTRLFDCLAYQLEHAPLEDMLSARENNKWRKYSTREVTEIVNQLSIGFLAQELSSEDGSIEGRDKIAIISANRPEWIMVDLAIQQIGAVSVPIYPTINVQELKFILQDAAVKIVFTGDQNLYQKIASIQDDLPELTTIFSFNSIPGVRHWKELLFDVSPELEQRLSQSKAEIRPEDLTTILYTSGTTGTPKGVMLSHRNIISNMFSSTLVIDEVGVRGKRAISFLPLNHAFERTATYCYIYSGISIYYAESMETIGENLREVRPSIFTTVPRLLEKVYETIVKKGSELTGIKKSLFDWAMKLAEGYEINTALPLSYKIQLVLANKLVFSKWREALGGEVKSIITGAAACQVRLLKVFSAANIIVQEGYGLTEASPIISGNRYPEKDRMFGTVGPLLKDVTVKIAEDGEILCKGPNVMMGYYKRPDLTADVIKDGWLHTGDIGTFIDGKFLKITDRKKELFKTSGGKYVAPQPIENKMAESRWIEQIMVVGEAQKYVGALIVPAFDALKEWYHHQGLTYPGNVAAVADKRVRALISEAVKQYNDFFNQVEQLKNFALLPKEWTIESGELTPTLKLKRKVLFERYQPVIQSLYA